MMGKVARLLAVLVAARVAMLEFRIFSGNHFVPSLYYWRSFNLPTPEQSHAKMEAWFEAHPFKLDFNEGLNKFFVGKLCEDPDSMVLPAGQFLPHVNGAYDTKLSTGMSIFSWLYRYAKQSQYYPRDLLYYRILQTALGYSGVITPGGQGNLKEEINELYAAGECKKATAKELALVSILSHNGEDWDTLLPLVEKLCNETCVTPGTCMESTPETENAFDHYVRQLTWVTWLRWGEYSNCRTAHNSERCLWPLQGGGLHTDKDGSQATIPYILKQLELHPDDLGAKWHLNLAHQTLGTYPEGVPAEFLANPDLFKAEDDVGVMKNLAKNAGVEVYNSFGAVVVEDFNMDGFMDTMHVGGSMRDPIKVYLGTAKMGEVVDISEKAVGKIPGGVNAKPADFNNDGFVDVFVCRGGWMNVKQPNSLLRNNGDGTFTDVTLSANVWLDGASHGVDFADFDNDGWLDVFSWDENQECRMFKNNKDETFTQVKLPYALKMCKLVKGAVAGDYNNDGYSDLFLSRYGYKNMLWRNEGGEWFTDVTDEAGVHDPTLSFPAGMFDFNQDGWLDLIAGGHLFEGADAVMSSYSGEHYFGQKLIADWFGVDQKWTHLYINNQNGTFTEISEQAGLRRHIMTMAMNYGDVDNDGFPDLYFGTGQPDVRSLVPNRLYRNDEGKKVLDITTSSNTGHVQKGHGISWNDFDQDGNMDIITSIAGVYSGDYFFDAFFRNPGQHGNFLKIRLEGTTDNKLGMGCRVTVVPDHGRPSYHFVHAGFSYGQNQITPLHVGVGAAKAVKSVSVYWPAANTTQTVTDVPVNAAIKIVQGEATFQGDPIKDIDRSALDAGILPAEVCHHHHDMAGETEEAQAEMPF